MSLALAFETIAPDNPPEPLADPGIVHAALSEQSIVNHSDSSDSSIDLIEEQDTLLTVGDAIDENEGELSVESLLFATIITDHACKRLGIKPLLNTPTLESVRLDDKVTVSTEDIHASMEGLWKGAKEIFKSMVSSTVNSWRFTRTRASRRERQFKKLLVDLNGAGSKPANSTVTINIKKLHENGRAPGNFKGYIDNYLKMSDFMIFKFENEAKTSYADFIKTCGNADVSNPSTFERELNKIASSIKDPRKRLPSQALTGPLPGGLRFFRDTEGEYAGPSSAAKKLDDIAFKNYPARAGFLLSGVQANIAMGDVKSLNGSEIRQIAQETYRILSKIDKRELTSQALMDSMYSLLPSPAGMVSGGLVSFFYGRYYEREDKGEQYLNSKKSPVKPPSYLKKQFKEEIKALKNAHSTLYKLQHYVMGNAAHCFVIVTDGLHGALKEHIKNLQH